MSVTGICQICESAEATFACDRCGRVVCDAHYDRETGLCTECARTATKEESERGGRTRNGSPDDWGEPR